MPTSWRLTAVAVHLSLLEMERVKPAAWAARRVLKRLGLAGKPVDRFVTGVVTGVARSIGLVDRVCERLWPGVCQGNPRARAALRALVYIALIDDKMRGVAREKLLEELSRIATKTAGISDPLGRLRGVKLEDVADPVEARWRVARWIYEGLVEAWGRDEAESILGWFSGGRSIHWLRVNTLRVDDPERVIGAVLGSARGRASVSRRVPNVVAVRGPLPQPVTHMLDEGILVAQDESAAAAPYLLRPKPRETIVDMCAAPGGKTSLLAEITRLRARIVSVEVSASRARAMRERLERLGADNVEVLVMDGRRAPEELGEGIADAVLLDPPCTSTGVLDKSPDARWQEPEALERLSRLQWELLEASWRLLRRGGRLLYVTCSLLPEENEEIIKRFLAEHPEARLEPLHSPYEPSPLLPGAMRAWPHRHETGGMFYALLWKR
ncbi:Fmu (Sun) domain protein [Pyrolobus fumarii 1A]|uniref:Fmu (Sun) domain protein n=1 Tax=Pyrolobus fumarii (strain DSM 11204 / 1A) TaxID=694429 RepID=G0EHF7_PYRF1|nr:RsmB/NOP family class I SAM-dependent RNA methyltransferase [Pyrolobus fumarii]AEM38532.1 Fmu (Sun) domain protein [Pyrolobus fumarii 1A]